MSTSMARRIQRELDELKKDAPETISAGPREGNLYVWDGMIIGSVATPYEGEMFKLLIQFPEGYPFCPPKVFFVTPIYHPNISKAGGICLDILKPAQWSPALTITKVLLSISSLLSDANPNDPLEAEIASQYKTDRRSYDLDAKRYTQMYAM